jgi:hypothetical protein
MMIFGMMKWREKAFSHSPARTVSVHPPDREHGCEQADNQGQIDADEDSRPDTDAWENDLQADRWIQQIHKQASKKSRHATSRRATPRRQSEDEIKTAGAEAKWRGQLQRLLMRGDGSGMAAAAAKTYSAERISRYPREHCDDLGYDHLLLRKLQGAEQQLRRCDGAGAVAGKRRNKNARDDADEQRVPAPSVTH